MKARTVQSKRRIVAASTFADDDDPKAHEYRKLSQSRRDLSPLAFQKAQKLSYFLWQRNPLATRIIEIVVDFCTGDEVRLVASIKRKDESGKAIDMKNPAAQELWDDFVNDPVNRFYEDLDKFARDLFLDGELVFSTTVNRKKNGDGTFSGDSTVRIGMIDPLNIVTVQPNPRDVRMIETINVASKDAASGIALKVINRDLDPDSETFGRMIGDVFFWRVNALTTQTRGTGNLVNVIDWLDLFDQFLFDALEGFRIRNAFFYTVVMKGLTQKQIDALQPKMKPPRIGGVRMTNEMTTWDVVSPDLKTMDIEQALKTFQTFLVGVKGFPEMWFGSGGETNLATGKVMSIPTMRMLRKAQVTIRQIIKEVFRFVIDQAIIGKTLKLRDGEFVECEISMFDFQRDDAAVVANAFMSTVQALIGSVEKGWVSDQTAKRVVDGLVGRLGIEVPQDESLDSLKRKKEIEEELEPYAESV